MHKFPPINGSNKRSWLAVLLLWWWKSERTEWLEEDHQLWLREFFLKSFVLWRKSFAKSIPERFMSLSCWGCMPRGTWKPSLHKGRLGFSFHKVVIWRWWWFRAFRKDWNLHCSHDITQEALRKWAQCISRWFTVELVMAGTLHWVATVSCCCFSLRLA